MKISDRIKKLGEQYPHKLKIVKKGIFWILIDEQAFRMSQEYDLKITKLDKNTIKVGFPNTAKKKWQTIFERREVGYVFFEIEGDILKEIGKYNGKKQLFDIDVENFDSTKQRILGLLKIGIEQKTQKNFLLKEKLENIYDILSHRLMLLPKKQRYFLRNKIETLFTDLLEYVYEYMYNLGERKELIKKIFSLSLVLREFTRFLYRKGFLRNDNVYLDLGERWLEVMKICKTIMNKS